MLEKPTRKESVLISHTVMFNSISVNRWLLMLKSTAALSVALFSERRMLTVRLKILCKNVGFKTTRLHRRGLRDSYSCSICRNRTLCGFVIVSDPLSHHIY